MYDVFIVKVRCLELVTLMNGDVLCTLRSGMIPSYEDICNFTCDTGYELTGSDTRTCQSDGSWNGTETTCTDGKCTLLNALVSF